METNRSRALLMNIASLVIVGTVGLLRRHIPLPSAALAFARGLIGGLSLWLWTRLRRRGPRERIPTKTLLGLVLNGAFLGVNWMLLFEAYEHTTIAVATLCYYLAPTLVMLSSPLLFGEKLTGKKLGCAAAALVGMALVAGVTGAERPDLRGVAFGLGAAIFYALVVILNKKIRGVDAYDRTVIQLLAAAAAMTPYLLLSGGSVVSGLSGGTALPGASHIKQLLLEVLFHVGQGLFGLGPLLTAFLVDARHFVIPLLVVALR